MTVGVGVTRFLLPTRSAVTSTPPRSTREAMGRGTAIAKDRGGVPGVGQVLLPSKSEATPDTPQGSWRMDVRMKGRGGDVEGSDGREGALTRRALTPPQFPRHTLDTVIGNTTRWSCTPVLAPLLSCRLVVGITHVTMCAPMMFAVVAMAMAAAASRSRPCHFISQAHGRLRSIGAAPPQAAQSRGGRLRRMVRRKWKKANMVEPTVPMTTPPSITTAHARSPAPSGTHTYLLRHLLCVRTPTRPSPTLKVVFQG